MDKFLNDYFNEHAFKTITTEEFIEYLKAHLLKDNKELEKELDIDAWVYGPGIPANAPRADRERFEKVDAQREKFLAGTAPAQLETTGWTTHEWLHFLRKMPKPLKQDQMKALDNTYHFTTSGNSEIANVWYVMAIASDYKPAYPEIESFLSKVGRRKFLEPIYEEMMKTGKEPMAREIYLKYRGNYHPLAHSTFDKLIIKTDMMKKQ